MPGIIVAVLITATVVLAGGCSGGGHTQSPQPSASVAPSPTATLLPADVLMSLGAIGADTKKINQDRGADPGTYAADCRTLGKDASSAGVETLPVTAWQDQWRKTAGELQKAADECSSAQSTGDTATMQQALTDMTAALDDFQTFNQMTG
jgi:hypothetical protein